MESTQATSPKRRVLLVSIVILFDFYTITAPGDFEEYLDIAGGVELDAQFPHPPDSMTPSLRQLPGARNLRPIFRTLDFPATRPLLFLAVERKNTAFIFLILFIPPTFCSTGRSETKGAEYGPKAELLPFGKQIVAGSVNTDAISPEALNLSSLTLETPRADCAVCLPLSFLAFLIAGKHRVIEPDVRQFVCHNVNEIIPGPAPGTGKDRYPSVWVKIDVQTVPLHRLLSRPHVGRNGYASPCVPRCGMNQSKERRFDALSRLRR